MQLRSVALLVCFTMACTGSTRPIARSEALAQLDAPGSVHERTARLVAWLNTRMPWVATDYRERTTDEILARGAGNCADHARVLQSLLESRSVLTRWVQEINIQPPSRSRQASAERLIEKRGPVASVFGLQHNDHRWLEVWDEAEKDWFPADSAIGITGLHAWTKARLGFGARPAPTKDMLLPFVVAASVDGQHPADRSHLYLVDAFDGAYQGRLSKLPTWSLWKEQVEAMAGLGLGAFRGEVNLHEHDAEMTRLRETYTRLKDEASAAGLD